MSQLYGLDTVIAIDNSQPLAVCIDVTAGTGKTFLYNLIVAYTRLANIAIGSHAGKTAFIPSIVMDSPKHVLPFHLRCQQLPLHQSLQWQLPLSPAFVMTLNSIRPDTSTSGIVYVYWCIRTWPTICSPLPNTRSKQTKYLRVASIRKQNWTKKYRLSRYLYIVLTLWGDYFYHAIFTSF